jgi:hypothetical protein
MTVSTADRSSDCTSVNMKEMENIGTRQEKLVYTFLANEYEDFFKVID